jgi:hypothetical protein
MSAPRPFSRFPLKLWALVVVSVLWVGRPSIADVLILNDGKAGYDVNGPVLRVHLLRSSFDADPEPDKGLAPQLVPGTRVSSHGRSIELEGMAGEPQLALTPVF